MDDNFRHCEQLVRDGDKDRFLATLFAPAPVRSALFALYAFNLEVARVRDSAREAMAGELRLQWWRDAVESGAGEAMAHPVAAALRQTIERFEIPVAPLIELIEARSFDLYDDPMASSAALEGYAVKTSSALIGIAASMMDRAAAGMTGVVRDAGIAYALTGLLRAFPLHAARGQLYVPLDVLERDGAHLEDVFGGRDTPELRAALADMRQQARVRYAAFAAAPIASAQAPAFLPVSLVPLYLDRLDRASANSFAVTEVPQWRRQWALWRAARKA